MTIPPPTTTTPTLADLLASTQRRINNLEQHDDGVNTSLENARATLTYLLAHESALRREAVLREALRNIAAVGHARASVERANDKLDACIEWANTALADSGSGG